MNQPEPTTTWELFLKDVYNALSNRLLQKKKSEWAANIDNSLRSKSLRAFSSLFEGKLSRLEHLHDDNIKHIDLDSDKLAQLNKLVTELLKTEPEFKIEGKKLRVRGQIIFGSSVERYMKRFPKLEAVEIFALDRVFIDENFDACGRKIQLSIISPVWEAEKVSINLNGEDAVDHEANAGHLDALGSPGNDGKPGAPGGNAGTFLGIGRKCVRCSGLTILANGGIGGRGQDGGDGQDGKNGKKPRNKIDSFSCEKYKDEWTKDQMIVNCGERYPEGGSIMQDCEVDGGGRPGGSGGNGGNGGSGGKAGTVNLLMLRGGVKTPISDKGAEGQPGAGGEGGVGGNKEEFKVTLSTYYPPGLGLSSCTEYNENFISEKGPPAEPGRPGIKIESTSPKIKYSTSPAVVINDYKNYLRENLKIPVIGTNLQRFLDYLETDKGVIGLYDTLGLVKDLLNLENQAKKLMEQGIPLVSFYQQLLDRVEKYQMQPHETQDAEEYRMVLTYLYRSAISKIHNINSNAYNDLVVDVRKNLAYVSANIEEWKNFKNLVEKNKTRNKYKDGIQRKIEEANSFIENDISKDIAKHIDKTTKQLDELYKEVVAQENAKQKEGEVLKEQREKLERQMALRAVLGVVQIASQALTLAGPVGAAAGAVIGGVTTVVENLATSDTATAAVSALPTAVTNTLNKLNEAYKQKHELFKTHLNKANTKMEEFLKDDTNEAPQAKQKVRDIHTKMSAKKSDLDELMKRANIEDPASVSNMYDIRKEIDELLKQGKSEMGNLPNGDKYKKVLGKVQDMIGLAKMGVELFNKAQGDLDKITATDNSIATVNEQLDKLDKFEQSIYTTMAPLIKSIRESQELIENSDGKSHAALDVTKWQVQGVIRDVRKQMQRMTAGFTAGDEITYYIDKVEYGMSMTIQMYDRIQSYVDQGALVDVITDVDSSTDISNNDLYTAVSDLKLKMSSNIISEFESSMKGVLLYVFPFATDYMKPLTPPEQFSLNGTDQLVDQLKTVENTLLREQSTIQMRDSQIMSNASFAEGGNLPPFFVWKHSENSDSIERLLRGEQVELKADILQSDIKENAVKFNDISVRFKPKNQQSQLKLAKYSVEMKHLGGSQYRCGEKFYEVPHEEQIIRRSAVDGEGLENGVFAKINNNEPVLSPFATWVLSLKSSDGDFSSLRGNLSEEMDLVLEGRGNYVQKDAAACNDLSKYYTEIGGSQGRFLDDDDDYYEEEFSGPVNYLASSISNAVKYLNPVNYITQGSPSPVEFLSGPPLQEYQQLSANTDDGITDNAMNYNLAGVPANLPLFELMIRKINKTKRHDQSAMSIQVQKDKELAQNLAYSAYAPN